MKNCKLIIDEKEMLLNYQVGQELLSQKKCLDAVEFLSQKLKEVEGYIESNKLGLRDHGTPLSGWETVDQL